MGNRLGVLLRGSELWQAQRGKSVERLDLYLRAGRKYGLEICFFSLEGVHQDGTVTAQFKRRRWQQQRVLLPAVIHNRAKLVSAEDNDKLRELERRYGATIYNAWNNYSKLIIHRLLSRHSQLRKYLPETAPFSPHRLQLFLDSEAFFIKPDQGALGEGIIKVTKQAPNRWQVEQSQSRWILSREELSPFLSRAVGDETYILQRAIDLRKHRNRPFDIRVAVQKGREGEWGVTGMVGKVAARGSYLSNVFQGGSVARLSRLFPLASERKEIIKKLKEISLQIAQYLDQQLPHVADLGFDLAVDQKGCPVFIEVNFKDQRYSFYEAGLMKTFYSTYDHPVGYGKYLLSNV